MHRFVGFACLIISLAASGWLYTDSNFFLAESRGAEGKEPPPAGEERVLEIAPGVLMRFCWVPEGEVQLGSPKKEHESVLSRYALGKGNPATEASYLQLEEEEARGKFTTKGFWMGKYEVTQAQWKAVMGKNPSFFQPGMNRPPLTRDKVTDTSRYPVDDVTWEACQEFLDKVNKRGGAPKVFGKSGRLAIPTEDEWEYACRGGKGNATAFYWGDELNGMQANCNGVNPYGTSTKGPNLARPCSVDDTNGGKYEKHPWGLCHMIGNVAEWCETSKPANKVMERTHVARGASFISTSVFMRTAYRLGSHRGHDIGFRVCFREGDEVAKADPGKAARKGGETATFAISPVNFMEFCWVPPGETQLGATKLEQDFLTRTLMDGKRPNWFNDEAEFVRGKYKSAGFWLGKFEVTQEEWQAVMRSNPSEFDGKKMNSAKGMDTSRFPVERVSWNDCQKFLEAINTRPDIEKIFGTTGKFVLPDEDAWEYACRGGKGNSRMYYWGNELNGTQANCDGTHPCGTAKKGPNLGRTAMVGSYEKDYPHPWGLCDMSGNVIEWCAKQEKGVSENYRPVRGGRWNGWAMDSRSAMKGGRPATDVDPGFGFRVCFMPGNGSP